MKRLIAMNCVLNPTMITVRPEYLYTNNSGELIEFSGRSTQKVLSDTVNLSKKRESNVISKKSRKKINKVVNWLCYSAVKKKGLFSTHTKKIHKWRINFITLTIQSGWHESSELFVPASDPITFKQNTVERMYDLKSNTFKKELLNPFLVYARKYFKLNNYVWKLETTKKGTLHVHITSDTFIAYNLLRNSWNRILKKKGLLDRYYNDTGHYDANSTDVHAQKKQIKNMAAYLCKEMAKNAGASKYIEGRLWGCSHNLSRAMDRKVVIMTETSDIKYFQALSKIVKNQKFIESKPDLFGKSLSLGMCFFPNPRDWLNSKIGIFKDTFLDTISFLRRGIIEPELEFC